MSALSGAEVFAFEGFSLDSRQRRLFGPEGRSLPLSGRAFDTLLYLVEHPNQLIDKQALMKAVWPNVVVEENNLNQNILIVRRALGETPGENRFIVTVPGRGYRFVAEVSRVSGSQGLGADPSKASAASPTPAATHPVTAATYASHAPPTARRTSIAVLPLVNLTRDPDKEYFGDGIAEELINMLTRVPGLKVPARTSSFAYKGRSTDVRQIARDLGVDALLEGSVRSAGDRIRLIVQLVDGQSGYHLWSQNYDRDFSDLFALQDELASAIVQAVRDKLNGSVDTVTQGPPAQDLEAYQLICVAVP